MAPWQGTCRGIRVGRRRGVSAPAAPGGPDPRAEGVDAPVIVGGIIPEEDRDWLLSHDVAAVYTPKDFDIARIMREVAELAAAHRNN